MLNEFKLRGLWRRIRSKTGIRTSKVAIKSHQPWYIRFGSYGLMMGIAAAVAWWLVDNSYRITGFNREEAKTQITLLTNANAQLQTDADKLKGQMNERDGQLKIEMAAQEELSRNLLQLQDENASLKEDLGFLRNIMSTGSLTEGLTITNLKVEPDTLPNEYRYRMLLTLGGQRKQDFKGKVQLIARVLHEKQTTMLSFPEDAILRAAGGEIEFKFYQKIDGRFKIPEGAKLLGIQVRVFGMPGGEIRSSKTLNL